MLSAELLDQLYRLTETEDTERSLRSLITEYLKLKIFFLKQQIAVHEMKWGMSYTDFEQRSPDMPGGFSYETEQEYYEWGEKTAMLDRYQKISGEWI